MATTNPLLIREVLLEQAEAARDGSLSLANDAKVMFALWKALPSVFVSPDAVYTRPYLSIDYDALFVYTRREGEATEALRMMISMFLGITTPWEAEIYEHQEFSSIRVEVNIGQYRLLVRIMNVLPSDYVYEVIRDVTDSNPHLSHKICRITGAKFVPFECLHEDVSREVFARQVYEFGLNHRYATLEANVLEALAAGLPVETPVPDSIVAKVGFDYDVEFIYTTDPKAIIRRALSHILGPIEWHGIWLKIAGVFSLQCVVDIPTETSRIRLKITIVSAHRKNEHLEYQGESNECIYYRALRKGDPGYMIEEPDSEL